MKLENIKALIMDMDGVLWRNETPINGYAQLFSYLNRSKTPYILATNNSAKTELEYQSKVRRLGAEIKAEQVLTSGRASINYLSTVLAKGDKVYVIGSSSFKAMTEEAGFVLSEENAKAVLVGIDFELNYQKLQIASLNVCQGALFIGSNPDKAFPVEQGISPGNGATLAAIEAATGVKAKIIGKPEPTMFEQALELMVVDAESTLMIGDRLETDILGAQKIGIKTALVLSGICRKEDLEQSAIQPDFIFEDIADFLEHYKSV